MIASVHKFARQMRQPSLKADGRSSITTKHRHDRPAWINWIVSLPIGAVICFVTAVNLYYVIRYQNVVQVAFPDVYGADREWLYDSDVTVPVDDSIVQAYLASASEQSALDFIHHMHTMPIRSVVASDACVARHGEDTGSFYVFCDDLRPSLQYPNWTSDWEAFTIQSVYLSTTQELHDGLAPVYIGILQAFHNARQGWYQHETIDRMVCTTPQLAGSSAQSTTSRMLFTRTHGVMRSVDCTSAMEQASTACRMIQTNPETILFHDGTNHPPIVKSYEVFRTATGVDLIMRSLSTRDGIGRRTVAETAWPTDNCLYVRDKSLGWFGVGYTVYSVTIPSIALVAKFELICVIMVIWLVKYQCQLSRLYPALHQSSRLGVFPVLVLQIVISAYDEQDIMRTIYSWERTTMAAWLLWCYIVASSAVSASLVSLTLIRTVFESSISEIGVLAAIFVAFPTALTQILIASVLYRSYTTENGLLPTPNDEDKCPPGLMSCASGHFNGLYLGYVLTIVPVLIQIAHTRYQRQKKQRTSFRVSDLQLQSPTLTSFERICLDELPVGKIVLDLMEPHVYIHGQPHVSPTTITACGFTMIQHRFLIRTKDLVLLLGAQYLPRPCLRDFSVMLWPLTVTSTGTLEVEASRRVFLTRIRRFHVVEQYAASLIYGVDEPLA